MATAADKRYIRKRNQVVKIIMGITVKYDNWREELYTESNPDATEATKAAELILAKFGINKPKTLKF